jgi:hypothetical protein
MTVGVLSEMLRPVPVLLRNPDCEGGDILTIWLRQASGRVSTGLSMRLRGMNERSTPAGAVASESSQTPLPAVAAQNGLNENHPPTEPRPQGAQTESPFSAACWKMPRSNRPEGDRRTWLLRLSLASPKGVCLVFLLHWRAARTIRIRSLCTGSLHWYSA